MLEGRKENDQIERSGLKVIVQVGCVGAQKLRFQTIDSTAFLRRQKIVLVYIYAHYVAALLDQGNRRCAGAAANFEHATTRERLNRGEPRNNLTPIGGQSPVQVVAHIHLSFGGRQVFVTSRCEIIEGLAEEVGTKSFLKFSACRVRKRPLLDRKLVRNE